MKTLRLLKWGNSIGIRLPLDVVRSIGAYIGEEFVVSVNEENGFVLTPLHNSQIDWTEAFNTLADKNEDELLIDDTIKNQDDKDWVWES